MSHGHDRALDMLATALKMEEKGKKFYDKAVADCRNSLGREIFRMLGDDEVIHLKRIQDIYDSLKEGNSWSEELASFRAKVRDTKSLFKKIAKKQDLKKAEASDIEALDIGIEFETASVDFYEKNLKEAVDPLERRFIEQLVVEERNHHQILSDMRLYYTDPEQWYMEKERPGLDGA